jgi:hypothetical protein
MPSGLFPSELTWNYRSYRQLVGFLGRGISSVERPLPTQDNTDTEETRTDIHASSGSRNHDPSVWVGEDISYLRPRGHCDRHLVQLRPLNKTDWDRQTGNAEAHRRDGHSMTLHAYWLEKLGEKKKNWLKCRREANPSSSTMALRSTQPLTEMSTRNLPGGKGRLAHKVDNLNAICDPIV